MHAVVKGLQVELNDYREKYYDLERVLTNHIHVGDKLTVPAHMANQRHNYGSCNTAVGSDKPWF